MLKQQLIDHLKEALQHLFQTHQLEWDEQLQIHVEQPQLPEHGDLSTNVAMQLARVFRKSPLQIADELVSQLRTSSSFLHLIDQVEVVKPGFINFFFNWNALSQTVETEYQFPLNRAQQKVVIEHTSINPNKAAHIGHLRNACIGDTMARLYRFAGYNVEVHNYIDDLGNQLADTVVGLLHIPLANKHHRFGDYCWDLYAEVNQAYQTQPDLKKKREEVLHQLEEGDNNIAWQGYLVAEKIVREQLQEMAEFDIHYDLLIWESDIVREGFWDQAFHLLKQSDRFVKETTGPLAGCWILKQADDDESDANHIQDKVLVRSNGILTYTAKDIAYHLWKFGLLKTDFAYQPFQEQLWTTARSGIVKSTYGRADRVLNVIDQRQEYPQQMVKEALQAVGWEEQADKLHHISYGVVSLSPATAERLGIDTSDQKASYTMSGRQGIGIKISELIEQMEKVIEEKRTRKSGISSREIAIAAIRYYLLRFGLKTEIVFDLDQATEVTGNTGVYLLYSYTRGFNILKKADTEVIQKPAQIKRKDFHPFELALLRHMITWQDTLESALKDAAPNYICNYAYELCSFFNQFYVECPVNKEENEQKRAFRLWLTKTYLQNLGEALTILGLPKPTEM